MTGSNSSQRTRGWLNMRTLEIFVAVVHANGMSGAAQMLGLTQPAVSQAIANLETSIKAKLIDRTTRPLKLTLIGSIIYKRSVEILDRARELEQVIDLELNETMPLLRMGMPNSFGSTAGPPLVKALAGMAAQWQILSGFNETSTRALIERQVDFIITSEDPVGGEGLVAVPIFQEPYIVVVPKGVGKSAEKLEEIGRSGPFIRYGNRSFIGRDVDAYLQRQGLEFPRRYQLDTSDAILAMVSDGIGWTISTPLCVLKYNPTLQFDCLPLESPQLTRKFSLVSRSTESRDMTLSIAEAASNAIYDRCLPSLQRIAPWAAFPRLKIKLPKGAREKPRA